MIHHVGGLQDMEDKRLLLRSNNVFNDLYVK